MPSQTILSLLIVLVFVAVHVFGKSMIFLLRTPRSAWLSVAGGVSVAYVFVNLLPELPEERESRFSDFALGTAAYAAFLIATQ